MKVLEASDAHIGQRNTWFTRRPDYEYIYNFLDLVKDKILSEPSSLLAYERIEDLSDIMGPDLVILTGNHDPDKELYKTLFPNATVASEFACDGVLYRHGHQHDIAQGILDKTLGWSYKYLPYFLRAFVKPTPAQQLNRGKIDDYNIHCAVISDRGFLYQQDKGISGGVIGHTHRSHSERDEPLGRPWIFESGSIGFTGEYTRVTDGEAKIWTVY
jgi:hypothetical protein